MERHTTTGNIEQIEWVIEEVLPLIKQHIANSAPDNDPNKCPEQKIAKELFIPPLGHIVWLTALAISPPPSKQKTHEIHQAIPTQIQGPNTDNNGVNVRVYEIVCLHDL